MTSELPEPCPVGKHQPAIVHRSGGDNDVEHFNTCGLCGRQIERGVGEPWQTEDQVADYINELMAQDRLEFEEEMYDALHPENRCPPRE